MTGGILICGVNWLGDSVFSMPVIQMLRRKYPGKRITILVTSNLAPLWRMHGSVDEVIEFQRTVCGTLRVARTVSRLGFETAFVFPNSFRSAVIPFLARVSTRVGMRGHQRAWMLTSVVSPCGRARSAHQSLEYLEVTGLGGSEDRLEIPLLSVPEPVAMEARKRLGGMSGPWVGLIPGAAYGPSKRWPREHFIEVGRGLVASRRCRVLIFGSEREVDLCNFVGRGIGEYCLNMAGKTSLQELAALLGECKAIIANDSGGMHLATAVGTRVVAIFGITDPAKTGPLGEGHRIIAQEGVRRSRDIARDSREARKSLLAIGPDRVLAAALELLEHEQK